MKIFESKKTESIFFLAIVILNSLPVLTNKFFPTMDGAAHLYNSNLINHLLFYGSSELNNFFAFNLQPVPNWTGHLILSVFNLFLPAFIAEKLFVLLYFFGLPYSFRALIKTIQPDNILIIYLVFPFVYSFLFLLGFYNFSIAIIFMLLALNHWIKRQNEILSIRNLVVLFVLSALTYFSHIFVFAVLMLEICLYALWQFLEKSGRRNGDYHKYVLMSLKKIAGLFIGTGLFIVLSIVYYNSQPASGPANFLDKYTLISWIETVRPIIIYNPDIEEAFTKKIFYILVMLIIIIAYTRINSLFSSEGNARRTGFNGFFSKVVLSGDFWLLSALILLALYFILPDSDGQAGFVSVRVCLLFFLFVILWIASQKLQKWLMIFAAVVVLYFNFRLVLYYSDEIESLNKTAVNCNALESYIKPNSIVLPVNCSDNWLKIHFSNYLGVDKPMIILDNYEAATEYFPLKWDCNITPNTILGNVGMNQTACLECDPNRYNSVQWRSNLNNVVDTIDYVFVLGDPSLNADSCRMDVMNVVRSDYQLLFSNEDCMLYEIK